MAEETSPEPCIIAVKGDGAEFQETEMTDKGAELKSPTTVMESKQDVKVDEVKDETLLNPSRAVIERDSTVAEVKHVLSETTSQIDKKKEEIDTLAENDDCGPISPVVIACLVIGTVAFVSLICYIFYSRNQTLAHDADLQEKILAGDTIATLNTLKMNTIESNNDIYHIVIIGMVFIGTGVVGYLVFYKDTSKHKDKKALKVAGMAKDALTTGERRVTALRIELSAQTVRVSGLTDRIKDYDKQIEEEKKRDIQNKKKIERLEEEKSKKEAELRLAGDDLKHMTTCYEDAKKKVTDLKDEVEKAEGSNRELQQKMAAGFVQLKNLQADVEREKSEKEDIRRRASQLEISQEMSRSQLRELEIRNAKLEQTRDYAAAAEKRAQREQVEAELRRVRAEQERAEADWKRARAKRERDDAKRELHYTQRELDDAKKKDGCVVS